MITLRTHQLEAVNALYNWFQTHEDGNPLIVVPTAGGKSLIQAKICEDALQWPNQRILNLTHVRELVGQNFGALMRLWPEAPAGIYSAGINKRQHHHQITFASIQSIYKKGELIGWRDLILIDEAHLLGDSDSSMYRIFLNHMKTINPGVRIVGFSATPYRMKSGFLHKGEGALFTDIAYDIPMTRLIKEGYLCPLVSKGAVTQGNTDKLAIQGGEFAMREAITEFDRQEMTNAAVKEMLQFAQDRKKWLIFCVSVEHALHVRDALRENGVRAETVSEKTSDGERARILAALKSGDLTAVTNVSVLTTGFDAPVIDMLVLLRPTMSPGLLVQMCGRGMRPLYWAGTDMSTPESRVAGINAGPKPNCLVLDMASNIERHGPVTHIMPREGYRKKKEDRDGKMCPNCRTIVAIAAKECDECHYVFQGIPRVIKHTTRASRLGIMSDVPHITTVPTWFNVDRTTFELHSKPMSPISLKVVYHCGPHKIPDWICLGHTGYAREKAIQWWMSRGGQMPAPSMASDALARIEEVCRFRAARVQAYLQGKYIRIKAPDLVPATGEIMSEGGNLGGRIVQEFINVPSTNPASAEAV